MDPNQKSASNLQRSAKPPMTWLFARLVVALADAIDDDKDRAAFLNAADREF